MRSTCQSDIRGVASGAAPDSGGKDVPIDDQPPTTDLPIRV
jgi:hypothetical protein